MFVIADSEGWGLHAICPLVLGAVDRRVAMLLAKLVMELLRWSIEEQLELTGASDGLEDRVEKAGVSEIDEAWMQRGVKLLGSAIATPRHAAEHADRCECGELSPSLLREGWMSGLEEVCV